MKPLLLILALAFSAHAQKPEDWKFIKELSGEIPDNPGLTVEVRAAQIARGGETVKLLWRIDYPWGSPGEIFKNVVPRGTDPTSISRIVSKIQLNCQTHVVTPITNSAEIYQFNGKKHKSKEQSFPLEAYHVVFAY